MVLPHAGLKIFMTARPEVRAARRARDLNLSGDREALAKLRKEIEIRDLRDRERDDSPLRRAKDAVVIDTSNMTFDEQVNRIIRLAAERFKIRLYGVSGRS